MSHMQAIYNDYSACCEEFLTGIELLAQRAFDQAVSCFFDAYRSVSENHSCYSIYLSYFGFARVLNGDHKAIELCRKAAQNNNNSDIFYVLARAELFCKNRKETVVALRKGFDVDGKHEGLNLIRSKIGYRRFKPIPFLPRKNILNEIIGKRIRKK